MQLHGLLLEQFEVQVVDPRELEKLVPLHFRLLVEQDLLVLQDLLLVLQDLLMVQQGLLLVQLGLLLVQLGLSLSVPCFSHLPKLLKSRRMEQGMALHAALS